MASRLFLVCVLGAAVSLAQADVEKGRLVYDSHCAHCHGAGGGGARGPSLAERKLARASNDSQLLALIVNGIPGTEMPPTRLTDEQGRHLVRYLNSLRATAAARPAGDAARGERVFKSKGDCARCHIVRGEGGRLGPELTSIGLRRSAAFLRQSLVEPGAATPENFAQYRSIIPMPDNFLIVRVVTGDGRKMEGVRLNEDPFTIQIRDFDDRLHTLDKSDLAEISRDRDRSPMPSFRDKLTAMEIGDLVAYLSSLKGAR